MKAVVMAGGEGTRLRPLTAHRPKPLAPVLNKPIMEHIIVLLKQHGITEIVVTLHYLADEIEGYFGDGSDWGVKLHYSVEDTPLGTAGSVKKAEHLLRDDTFVIVSGDALTDLDLTRAIDFHCTRDSLATIVLSHVPNPLEFGVVITDEEGRIRRFLEKPSWGEVFSDTVNTGMYILEPAVFDYMVAGGNYDWSQDIFPRLLMDDRPLYGYVMPDYWCDVGNLNQYREAQYTVLDGRTNIAIGGQERNQVWVGDGCKIAPDAEISPPTVLGRGVRVKAGARIGPYSVIGDNCIIDEGAVVHRSVLWDNVYVGANCVLTSCTVCSKVAMQEDCTIQEGAIVGEGCRIERESTIRTQIKLWPDKIIEAGSTVTMSLIWGQKWLGSLFRNLGVSGIANIEITPDFATKLGACYGAFLKRGATVITARDPGLPARMIKRAIISGLMSVGCDVLDMRSMPLPIMRHTLRGSEAAGGIYVRVAPSSPRLLLIEFLDKDGVYLSKAAERKVETMFFREDFGRADIEQIGHLDFASRSIEQYHEDYARHIDPAPIVARRFKVVADFTYGRVASIFPAALGRLGCDVVALNAYVDPSKAPRSLDERAQLHPNLAQIVQTLRADLGVMFENDGERLTLVDEAGRIVMGADLLTLYAVLVARTRSRARVAVPVTAPARMEQIVGLHGGVVHRTKTDVRSLMASAAAADKKTPPADFAGDLEGGFCFSEFQPAFDSMFAFGKLLEMLSTTGLTVRELVDEIPPIHLARATVRCPWEDKGRVMREITAEAGDIGEEDMVDGVRIRTDPGWALVLPDAADPYFHVYAEHETMEKATTLTATYVRRIEALRDAR
ncbi:MAG TPA: mannose-1-phosphate guanyltransferase [Chthonomonadales bacterium]|nr:mannose-1-phosphate guanyltransferase [Chthonomonadales bacterium]